MPGIHEPPGSQWTPRYMMYHDKSNKVDYLEQRDYEHITTLVNECNPDTIAISQFDNEELITALGRKYSVRTVDSKTLSMRWLETMALNRFWYTNLSME